MFQIGPLVLLMCLGLTVVMARFGPDDNVCGMKEYNQTAKERPNQPKPKLPAQWSVRVEVDMYELGYSLDVHEYYDETNNRGAVVQWKNGVKTHFIYLYSTSEMLVLRYDESGSPPSCEVKSLQSSTTLDYFGLKSLNNGSELVYTPGAALHFLGAGTEVPMGTVFTKTGIPGLAWESCTYIEAMDATFVIDWIFSTNSGWSSPYNFTVPLERTASGTMHLNGSAKQIDRKYTYIDFRLLKDFDIFQTPSGTYCPDRVSTRQLPDVPAMFSLSYEIVDKLSDTVSWEKVDYDYELKLVRIDSIPDPGSISPYGYNLLSRVSDFDSGVTYVLDRILGNCSILPVSEGGAGHRQSDTIDTRQEFFYVDKGHYQYTGQRIVRGITTDTFIAVRDLSEGAGPSVNGTIEWYFAANSWTSKEVNTTNYQIPVRFVMRGANIQRVTNIYDFSTRNPHVWRRDLSPCFSPNHQHHFRITFPATHAKDVVADINGFKSVFVKTVVAVTLISPVRVNRLEVDFPVEEVTVTGTLLDAPTLPSSGGSHKLVPLQAAVNALTAAVNQNSFTVVMPHGGPSLTATKLQ